MFRKRNHLGIGRIAQLAITGLIIVGFTSGFYFLFTQGFSVTSSLPPQITLSNGQCNLTNQSQDVTCSLIIKFDQNGLINIRSVNVTEFPRQVAFLSISYFPISGPSARNLTFDFHNSHTVKVVPGTRLTIFINFDTETLYEIISVQSSSV